MEKFVRLTAKACPLMIPNLNTDQILPARYLKWPRSRGLGAVVFHDFRLDAKAIRGMTSRSIKTPTGRQDPAGRTQLRERLLTRSAVYAL